MLKRCKELMESVYGSFEASQPYIPKPYKEGQRRYLWTDAYGVCNFISLYMETNEEVYLKQANALIEDVHLTLGKDRQSNKRLGPSTPEHPLLGGLRIGKKHDEFHSDGDGQYFHYLTKWMFALSRMSLVTRNDKYNQWAIEMAQSIHSHFTTPGGRMVWKISIDMKRPLVNSEGNLDPFDGYVTYRLLNQVHQHFHPNAPSILRNEITELEKMVMKKFPHYNSSDPLDLGETLWIAHWFRDEPWAKHLIDRALEGLEELWQDGYFDHSMRSYRLAFREFGTTIGLQCLGMGGGWGERVGELHEFWKDEVWERDRDIKVVIFVFN